MTKAYMAQEWFAVLKREAETTPQREMAQKLGYSLTSINLVLNGKYPGGTDKIAERVMMVYTNLTCPYSGAVITLQDCRDTAHAPAPTHNPMKMQQWRACRSCPNRPPEKASR